MLIYAFGLDTDKTYLSFLRRALDAGALIEAINLRAMSREPWRLSVPALSGESVVYGAESPVVLDPGGSYFNRLIDLSPVLPEPEGQAWRQMLIGIYAFLETVAGPIVNRPGAHT